MAASFRARSIVYARRARVLGSLCGSRARANPAAEEGRRVPDQRALRDPDRRRQRHGAVREERRQAQSAGQHVQADDHRGRAARDRAGQAQIRRRDDRQRERLAQGRRAVRRLGDVRGAQQPGERARPAAWRDDPVRQRCLHRARRRHRRQRAGVRRHDEQARARARADAVALHQFDRPARSRPQHDGARTRQARAAHHQDLSGGLQDLRRARIHLEQDAPAEPQSAARDGHRRRRAEDRLHQGGRLRAGRLGGEQRAAPDRRGQRLQDHEGARRRERASCSNGASAPSRRGRCSPQARRSARRSSTAAHKGRVPLVSPTPIRLLVPRAMSREAQRQGGLFRSRDGAGAEGQADRHAEGLARRERRARSAAAGRRGRRRRRPARSAPSTRWASW